MNEVIQAIKERKSCKKYKSTTVSKQDIDEIIEAGTYAASGQGKQGYIIIAITNKEVRDALSKANAEVMNVDKDPFYGAPVVLSVLKDTNVRTSEDDAALVIGNMLLAASSKGLGSCWIHRCKEQFESEVGKKLLSDLGIEDHYVGVGNCIVGYPDGELHAPIERKENRVYYVD